MGNCYSIEHIAEDHIHTDKKCSTEKPHRHKMRNRKGSTAFERSVIGYWGLQLVLLDPYSRP